MRLNAFRSKALLPLLAPAFLIGFVFAGHTPCQGEKGMGGAGSHCMLAKNITKTAEMTDDGAVVTMKGKTAEAVGHIKSHLEAHAKGESCPGCALSRQGVTSKVELTEDGGVITATGDSPEAIKAVQEWAKMKDCCCSKGKKGSA